LFLRTNADVSLYDTWVNAFATDELKQEHTCHACKRYLNGIGTFGVIADDFNSVVPFAMPETNDAFFAEVPEAYHKPYEAVLKALNSNGWDIPLKQSIVDFGDIFGTEEAGGWAHMALDYSQIKRARLLDVFNAHFANPEGTGLGRTEVKLTQDWLTVCINTVDTNPIPNDQLRKSDLGTLERIREFVELTKTCDRSLLVRAEMIINGIGFLRTRNSVVGALIEDISKGISLEAALKAYNKYTDPRNYMRPTRMPSEAKFEQDVAFLTEHGYDKYMPMRLATMDDLREHDMLTWERKKDEVEVKEAAKPKDIFAKQREKVKAANGTAVKAKPTYTKVGTETVSLAYITGEVFGNPDKIAEVIFNPHVLNWGSFAISHVTEGNNLFEDGQMVRPFISSQQVYPYEIHRYYSLENKDAQAYRIAPDAQTGDKVLSIIYDACKWKIKLAAPLFAAGLVKELRDRRVTIENYMQTNPVNIDDNGNVLEYENTVLSIPVLIGHAITVRTTDGFEREYRIGSRK